MATKPTPGGSDGTYGTEMNAFLDIEHNADGTHNGSIEFPVNGSSTAILQKYFTGTLDGDTSTSVAHGLADIDKILHVSGCAFSTDGFYKVYDNQFSQVAANQFNLQFDGTNVQFNSVGANLQGQKYRIKIDYIL